MRFLSIDNERKNMYKLDLSIEKTAEKNNQQDLSADKTLKNADV